MPRSSIRIPKYSLLVPLSFRKTNAPNAVNSDSALRSKDALIAVVWFKPFKSNKGAVTEPHRMTRVKILQSLPDILSSVPGVSSIQRIFLLRGVRWIPNRRRPPTKYIIPAVTVGCTFCSVILLNVELIPKRIAEAMALT